MKLKEIVCDLKYAKILKDLGVDQTKSFSVFYSDDWKLVSPFEFAITDSTGLCFNRESEEGQKKFISTFTTDELLEILPKEIQHGKNDFSSYYLCMGYDGEHGLPMVWYEDNDLTGQDMWISRSDKKMVNALAKILIWLLKKEKIQISNKTKEKKIKREIPIERVLYKRMGKFFYSFKYNSWFVKTKTIIENDSKYGYWYKSSLVNESNQNVLEEICGRSHSDLSQRMLSYVNNPLNF